VLFISIVLLVFSSHLSMISALLAAIISRFGQWLVPEMTYYVSNGMLNLAQLNLVSGTTPQLGL